MTDLHVERVNIRSSLQDSKIGTLVAGLPALKKPAICGRPSGALPT
jgi:hypothetical protein